MKFLVSLCDRFGKRVLPSVSESSTIEISQESTRDRHGLLTSLISISQDDEDDEDAEDDEDDDSAAFLGRSSDALAKLRPWRRLPKL